MCRQAAQKAELTDECHEHRDQEPSVAAVVAEDHRIPNHWSETLILRTLVLITWLIVAIHSHAHHEVSELNPYELAVHIIVDDDCPLETEDVDHVVNGVWTRSRLNPDYSGRSREKVGASADLQ